MIVKFKTAHGYLSFQPSGRIEYREEAGPWEEFDIEGLVVGGTPGPTPDEPIEPTPAMNAAYVATIKSICVTANIPLSGPCGAFAITRRVAWGLRHLGAGLLSKPSGNNCEGYATDIICWPSRAFDILSDGGGSNGPIWSEVGVDDLANRWRPPVKP